MTNGDVNPNCSECGAYMQHNRHKGHLDFDYHRIVLECPRCENERTIQILPDEEPDKKKKWSEAIERQMLGTAKPDDPEEPKMKPVGELMEVAE